MLSSSSFGERLLLLQLVLACHGVADRVRFTNSPSLERTLRAQPKTFKLEVPGSRPITIIETGEVPDYERTYREKKSGTETNSKREYDDTHHRKTKDYIVPGSTHEGTQRESSRRMYDKEFDDVDKPRCYGPSCNGLNMTRKTVYSPDLLNNFLKEYADKIKNADQKTKDRLHQMETSTQLHHIIVADKAFQKNKITEKIDLQVQDDNRKLGGSWEADSTRLKHPFDEHEGWVALEAIPWTKSKVSKWQANTHKLIKPSGSHDRDHPGYSDRFSTSGYTKPDYDRYPPASYEKPDSEYDGARPQGHPLQSPKPEAYDYRPGYGQSDDWPNESAARPPWTKPQSYKPYVQPTPDWGPDPVRKPHRPDCDHSEHGDHVTGYDDNRRVTTSYDGAIITDGHAGDFPTSALANRLNGNYRRPTQVVYADLSNHPTSHPASGDGQWVLLSTTKGYQFPKSRQRSLSVAPSSSLLSHRSVRLTVLPAVDGSKENMTTSHGGLLEVHPNFQSVDESRRLYESMQRLNGTRPKRPRIKKLVAADAGPDSSAVMAAVGAGLVPATMAMIMPMVLGRKRRSPIIINPFLFVQNVTQQPHLDYESTLQRTL